LRIFGHAAKIVLKRQLLLLLNFASWLRRAGDNQRFPQCIVSANPPKLPVDGLKLDDIGRRQGRVLDDAQSQFIWQ
jgi:hypothetical protein